MILRKKDISDFSRIFGCTDNDDTFDIFETDHKDFIIIYFCFLGMGGISTNLYKSHAAKYESTMVISAKISHS